MKSEHLCFVSVLLLTAFHLRAQQPDLLKLAGSDSLKRQPVTNAFKSSRVINGHSMEFIGKGVLDVRILHRFGYLNSGAKNFFGLDEANMRLGFDYGLGNNLTVGVGRSNINKELDGFIKYRPLVQSTGPGAFPFSLVLVSGLTWNTTTDAGGISKMKYSSRLGFYHELIIGRKFTERFSMQVAPVFVHRNFVDSAGNDTWAIEIGGRLKLSKRVAFVVDYIPVVSGRQPGTYDPLAVGFDIETGGHVFQLHFSSATGMNEKELITHTTGDFWKGDIRFGFNLSRVFTVAKKARKSW